jgi:translation initiation factor IF-3
LLRGKQIRLIDSKNEPLGIVSFEQAVARAEELGEDLVEVAQQATPPVCKIMDFGKFHYEQAKRQREAKKKQHQHKLKEIKFHPNIDPHDYQTKVIHALEFFEKGHKVKASMFFRGREMSHVELGRRVMERFISDTAEHGVVESRPQQSGRMIVALLAPKAKKA